MSQAADKCIVIEDLVKKGIEAYEAKMKNGPPVAHKHTSIKLAQVCLICKGVSRPDCMPKLKEPVSSCAARNIILNMVKIRISV